MVKLELVYGFEVMEFNPFMCDSIRRSIRDDLEYLLYALTQDIFWVHVSIDAGIING